jgi:hypothetical protein
MNIRECFKKEEEKKKERRKGPHMPFRKVHGRVATASGTGTRTVQKLRKKVVVLSQNESYVA